MIPHCVCDLKIQGNTVKKKKKNTVQFILWEQEHVHVILLLINSI